MADTVSYIHFLIEGPSICATVSSDALWTRVLGIAQVHDEARLKRLCIEGLQASFCHGIWVYCGTSEKASVQALAQQAAYLRRLQVGITFAQDVHHQRQPSPGSRGKTDSVLPVQSYRTARSKELSEWSCHIAAGQALRVRSETGFSCRAYKTKSDSWTAKANDASFYPVCLSLDYTLDRCFFDLKCQRCAGQTWPKPQFLPPSTP